MKYRSELDGLRAIAVLSVIAAHSGAPGFSRDGGLAGVTLFFVLSGYLISSLLLAERDEAGRVSLGSFYLRRALRLFPALVALLIVVAAGTALNLWPSAGGDMAIAIPAVVFYVGDLAAGTLGVLGHTWSLAAEEQFYLVWPILLLIALQFTSRRTIGLLVIGLGLLVTPWRVYLVQDGQLLHAYAWTDAHVDALLFGCAIALLKVRLPSIIGWIGVMGIVGSAMFWATGSGLVVMDPLVAVFGVLAVAGCPAAIRWSPLAYVGRISYGLYLWHYLFIWWGLSWPVVILVSFIVGSLSYAIVERPFLRLKDRLRTIPETSPVRGLVDQRPAAQP